MKYKNTKRKINKLYRKNLKNKDDINKKINEEKRFSFKDNLFKYIINLVNLQKSFTPISLSIHYVSIQSIYFEPEGYWESV